MAKPKSSDLTKTEAKSDSSKVDTITYRRDKLLTFKRYAKRVDLLGALLEENKVYTLAQVERILNNFMKGQVN